MRMASEVETASTASSRLAARAAKPASWCWRALLMADELHDTRITLTTMQAELSKLPRPEKETRRRLARLADRAEEIAAGLEQS